MLSYPFVIGLMMFDDVSCSTIKRLPQQNFCRYLNAKLQKRTLCLNDSDAAKRSFWPSKTSTILTTSLFDNSLFLTNNVTSVFMHQLEVLKLQNEQCCLNGCTLKPIGSRDFRKRTGTKQMFEHFGPC